MNGKQNPQQGKLNDHNLDKGDFIFAVRPQTTAIQPTVTPQPEEQRRVGFFQRGNATQKMTDSGLCIAHPSLPLNTVVIVTNTITGKEVEATVTNRISISHDSIADLSRDVWQALELNSDTYITLSVIGSFRVH